MSEEAKPAVAGQVERRVMQQRVTAAEQEAKNKATELEEARATVKRLEREHSERPTGAAGSAACGSGKGS